MRPYTSTLALGLALLSAAPAGGAVLTYNFSRGMSKDLTVIDADGAAPNQSVYANIRADRGAWQRERLGQKGYVALSLTASEDAAAAQSNWLISAPVAVAEGDIVRWEARSAVSSTPESYRIMVAPDTGAEPQQLDWTPVYTCEAESEDWTLRMAPITSFAGQTVRVAVECTSRNAFMLALAELTIGKPEDLKLHIAPRTRHFQGGADEVVVEGGLTNFGRQLNGAALRLTAGDFTAELPLASLATGDSTDYRFTLPMAQGTHASYRLSVVEAGGTETALTDDDEISNSYFPRRMLVDHFTGVWCVNCPYYGVKYREWVRNHERDLIIVEPHVNDILTDAEYFAPFKETIFSVPSVIANRNKATYNSDAALRGELTAPVNFSLSVDGAALSADGSTVTLDITAQCARTLDNTSDRYRFGMTMLYDFHEDAKFGQYAQQNNASSTSADVYYYMPGLIHNRYMTYKNVPVGGKGSVEGLASSLPSAITAGEPMRFSHSLAVATPERASNPSVLITVQDTQTGYCYQAEQVFLSSITSGIRDITAPEADFAVSRTGSGLAVSGLQAGRAYDIRLRTFDGRTLQSGRLTADASGRATLRCGSRGLLLLTVGGRTAKVAPAAH